MERPRAQLQKVARDILGKLSPDEAVIAAWPLICGSSVAQRTEAIAFAEGKLEVRVPDLTWRNQLEQFTPHYLNAYAQLLGPKMTSIQYIVATKKPAMKISDE